MVPALGDEDLDSGLEGVGIDVDRYDHGHGRCDNACIPTRASGIPGPPDDDQLQPLPPSPSRTPHPIAT
jgi:hypothetical protein